MLDSSLSGKLVSAISQLSAYYDRFQLTFTCQLFFAVLNTGSSQRWPSNYPNSDNYHPRISEKRSSATHSSGINYTVIGKLFASKIYPRAAPQNRKFPELCSSLHLKLNKQLSILNTLHCIEIDSHVSSGYCKATQVSLSPSCFV